jgi:haloalkane dehalogenase
VTSIVRAYSEWLSQSQIPKLFIAADPGAVITTDSENQRFCETLKSQQEVTVKGRHFVQEDSPDEIGTALRRFVTETRRSDAKSQG